MNLIDIINAPWAITPEKHREIVSIYQRHMAGPKIDFEGAVQAAGGRMQDLDEMTFEVVNGVAVIPIQGVMMRRLGFFSRLMGGRSTVQIGDAIRQAEGDPEVQAIVLDIDSPGGEVSGTQELATLVESIDKPVVAYTSGMMASAAYWVGSAADEVVISGDTNAVGSIGVVATHVDISRALNDFGVKVSEITAGRYKRVTSAFEPLSQEGRETLQAEVDHLYGVFLAAVARHRNSTAEDVHERMANGRIFIGRQALDAGLVDGVSALDDVVSRLTTAGVPADPTTVSVPHVRVWDAPDYSTQTVTTTSDDDGEPDMDFSDLNVEVLREQCPALVESIESTAVSAARQAGADAERARIQAVLEQSMPGHDALVQTLAFDGKTTGPEAAVQVLKAEKAAGAGAARDLADDAPDPVASPDAPSPQDPGEDENAPLDERAQATWKRDPKLRAEFGGDFDRYMAYRKAEDERLVRRLGDAK